MLHLEKIRLGELEEKVRKEEGIDLKGCVLKEMIQWDCRVVGEEIKCFAVERLFRRYGFNLLLKPRWGRGLSYANRGGGGARCANGRTIEVTGLERIGEEGR